MSFLRRVTHATGLVSHSKRQPGGLPLVAKPRLHGQNYIRDLKRRGSDVMHTCLGNHGKFPHDLRIRVTGNVPQAFVSQVAAAMLPALCNQQRMDVRPTGFGVSEPQCRLRRGPFAPRLDVWFVPFLQ